MKHILIIFFLMVSFTSLSQISKIKDTTEICLPYVVAKQIMLDLNRLDSTTTMLKLSEDQIIELDKKIELQVSIINVMEEKIKTSDTIVEKTNEKFQIVDNINKELTSDIKKLKRKNTITQIVSGIIVGGLTYIIIGK